MIEFFSNSKPKKRLHSNEMQPLLMSGLATRNNTENLTF
jgi:hypothetical protein